LKAYLFPSLETEHIFGNYYKFTRLAVRRTRTAVPFIYGNQKPTYVSLEEGLRLVKSATETVAITEPRSLNKQVYKGCKPEIACGTLPAGLNPAMREYREKG
jgi:hypothetical protein